MEQGEIRLGVIGCGGFGLYALQQFAQVPGVKRDRFLNVQVPIAPLMRARRFEIFVRVADLLEMSVESAVLIQQRVLGAAVDAEGRPFCGQQLLGQGEDILRSAFRMLSEDAAHLHLERLLGIGRVRPVRESQRAGVAHRRGE